MISSVKLPKIRQDARVNRALILLVLAGCGGDDPPPSISYGPVGPLVGDAGRGSWRFGAASAATQIEDANDRTDWWFWTAPESQGGLDRGTFVGEASRGHALALEDVGLLTAMNLDSYRFSIEWSRIEPERDVIDEEALAHYGALLDALVAAGVRPMITVHHFSNPVWVADPRDPDCLAGPTDENLCGFGHPEGGPLIVEEMRQHAALLAERFGDRVDEWGTVNEPVNYLLAGYGLGSFPPGKQEILSVAIDPEVLRKNDKEMYASLREKFSEAYQRAKKLDIYHQQAQSIPHKSNPCTQVHELVNALRALSSQNIKTKKVRT